MNILLPLAQLFIAFTLINIWVFRYPQMIHEFRQYQLPNWLRVFTRFSKLALAALLIVGVWYPTVGILATQILMVFMASAILVHVRVKNPLKKVVPALSVLALCLLITLAMGQVTPGIAFVD